MIHWKSQKYQFWLILTYLWNTKTQKFATDLAKLADKNRKRQLSNLLTEEIAKRSYLTKKSLVKLIPESTIFATVQNYLPVRI